MYVFIISFVSYAKSIKRKFYIFVQKNIHVVKALMNYSVLLQDKIVKGLRITQNDINRTILINDFDQIKLLKSGPNGPVLEVMTFGQFYDRSICLDYQNGQSQSKIKMTETSKTKLTFEKLLDENELIDFVVMVYQQANRMNLNQLVIYDIDKD